jgi:hypothetical protein
LRHSIKLKIAKQELIDRIQDGRLRHYGKSSAGYKMGNYHPILMKIGIKAQTGKLRSKISKAEV